jgi:hypothetical protein
MVKGTAASTMLKRMDQERALKGTASLTSLFQKVRGVGLPAGLCDAQRTCRPAERATVRQHQHRYSNAPGDTRRAGTGETRERAAAR